MLNSNEWSTWNAYSRSSGHKLNLSKCIIYSLPKKNILKIINAN